MSESPAISYLDPVEQGNTLTEKAVDVHVIGGAEFLARWYHSPLESDLLIWFDSGGQVARFQLNSGGQIVDWVYGEGLQTGLIVEIEIQNEVKGRSAGQAAGRPVEAAETIRFDADLAQGTLATARLVLGHCTSLKQDVREFVVRQLDSDARRKPAIHASRSRFWGRFKRWTTGA